jgi:hypothetical protein
MLYFLHKSHNFYFLPDHQNKLIFQGSVCLFKSLEYSSLKFLLNGPTVKPPHCDHLPTTATVLVAHFLSTFGQRPTLNNGPLIPILVVVCRFDCIYLTYFFPKIHIVTKGTKKVDVVDRWSLFRAFLFGKNSKYNPKMVVVIDRWTVFGGGR